LCFKSSNKQPIDEKHQELAWGSVVKSDSEIIEVYPMLYHGERFMSKGKVLLVDPANLAEWYQLPCNGKVVLTLYKLVSGAHAHGSCLNYMFDIEIKFV
jgi:hypothetical protein